ncbi:MAG TPA: dockerin type I repeat-containing protein [Terriglobales bacterium]|nr:dockerin type I repeat-containing protein [Terriglobales bacterium]
MAVRTFDTLCNPLSDIRIVNDVIDLGDVFWTQRIAITDSNGYVVLWSDSRYKRDLWAQRFNAANEPQGSNYRINSVPGSLATPSGAGWNQLDYALAIHKNTVVFAWDDFRNYNMYNADIYAKLLNLDKIGYYCRGDLNLDGIVSVSDIIYLINYLFKNGSGILPEWTGDANSDGKMTVSDVVYLVNYLFKGGPAPQK